MSIKKKCFDRIASTTLRDFLFLFIARSSLAAIIKITFPTLKIIVKMNSHNDELSARTMRHNQRLGNQKRIKKSTASGQKTNDTEMQQV